MDKVVLTFDDGPHPEHTPRILDALAKEQVQAVFFVLGERVQAPGGVDLMRRIVAGGHLVGNHTFSHLRLTELSPEDVRSQIQRAHELIAEFESNTRYFRPPFGASNRQVNSIAKELKYETVMWNASFEDWQPENQPAGWVDIAMNEITARHLAVCLAHDLPHTAEHLPKLLRRVKECPNRRFVRYDHRKDFMWLVRGIGSHLHNSLKRGVTASPAA